jgi:hypothetical protein
MHFSADRTKLYVACDDDDVIEIIDVDKLDGTSPETFAIDESCVESTSLVKNARPWLSLIRIRR